jgi:N4-gp56 family major capsid protein
MNTRGEERLAQIDNGFRELQNLAGTITSSVASLEPTEIIQRQIEEAARANLVAMQVVKVNRDLVGSPARSLIVGKRGTITASSVNEGSTITLVNPTYTPATLTPSKFGVAVEITTESINAFQFDLINDYLAEAGYAMAKYWDTQVVTAMEAENVWNYSGATVTATTSGVLSYDDVVNAVAAVRGQNWNADTLLINPAQQQDLLKDTKFINSAAYGGNTPLLNGEIGKFAGVRVLVSTQVAAGSAIVFDSAHAVIAAVKRDMTVKRDELPARDAIGLYVTQMAAVSVLNETAGAVITSC